MIWYFIAALAILFLLNCIWISLKWRFYSRNDWMFPQIDNLRRYNALLRVWPTDNGFFSLMFSSFRHCLSAAASALLIWFVNKGWLNTFLLALNALYACTVFLRYRVRNRDYKTAGPASQELLKRVRSACLSVFAFSVVCYLILIFVYAQRP